METNGLGGVGENGCSKDMAWRPASGMRQLGVMMYWMPLSLGRFTGIAKILAVIPVGPVQVICIRCGRISLLSLDSTVESGRGGGSVGRRGGGVSFHTGVGRVGGGGESSVISCWGRDAVVGTTGCESVGCWIRRLYRAVAAAQLINPMAIALNIGCSGKPFFLVSAFGTGFWGMAGSCLEFCSKVSK